MTPARPKVSCRPPRGRPAVADMARSGDRAITLRAEYDNNLAHSPKSRVVTVSDSKGFISLRGVEVHNLKHVNLDIPHRKLVALCGLSGSGKTSLALDTLYAEGQRRYIESFSAYTRQFFERLEKPAAEKISGIPP